MSKEIVLQKDIDCIYEEINTLIRQKKGNVKKVVNDSMISLYWGIGKKLTDEITVSVLLMKLVHDWQENMARALIKLLFQE